MNFPDTTSGRQNPAIHISLSAVHAVTTRAYFSSIRKRQSSISERKGQEHSQGLEVGWGQRFWSSQWWIRQLKCTTWNCP